MVTAVTSTVIKFEGHQNDRDLEAAFMATCSPPTTAYASRYLGLAQLASRGHPQKALGCRQYHAAIAVKGCKDKRYTTRIETRRPKVDFDVNY
ncbi:hypothetical protein WJX82_006333 [Trebouxia sp. C0006]